MATRKKANQPAPLTPSEVEKTDLNFVNGGDTLTLRYCFVDELVLLEGNPKLHDLGKLADSIVENGFRDPPSWDANLNGGVGGIVEGNGRAECLKLMQDQGRSVPRGIAVSNDGRWAMPILFGVDARSESAAKRYAIDHNNLTMSGGNGFTALDVSRMYDIELYTSYLGTIESDLPLTVDADDLALLMKVAANEMEFNSPEGSASEGLWGNSGEDDEDDEDLLDEPPESSVRMLNLFFDTETHPQVMGWIEALNEIYGTENPTDCVYQALKTAVEKVVES